MIKQNKKIRLLKNFKMETTISLSLPSTIKEKDIYSMFSGLLILVKELAKNEAQNTKAHSEIAYQHLLKMYTASVKQMNKYKALYFQTLKEVN